MNETKGNRFDMPPPHGAGEIAWCPGCGNFAILDAVKDALAGLGKKPEEVVMVSGIGQAAKAPHYLRAHFFNGLHGRALPPATAIKAANPTLTVVVESGDGDLYGEGGNHFLHALRRNPDITVLAHDNMVYGLTKGQASPTSMEGMVTPAQPEGVAEEPFNPVAVAIALDAPFVARAFAGDKEGMRDMIAQAVAHTGFALVDILQPCVTFNKLNTWQWFRDRTAPLPAGHDASDRAAALARALQAEKLFLGVFYRHERRRTFEETLPAYRADKTPLFARSPDPALLADLVRSRR
jgi:2-oxoglutarate/2-oxoacid ferredoxin oxidoreductase subunit beta